MNMFARFDENPAMTLQAIKETKRYGRTDARTDARTEGQHENSIPSTNKVCGGYKKIQRKFVNIFLSSSFNISFGCSKEPSHRDGSFEYP